MLPKSEREKMEASWRQRWVDSAKPEDWPEDFRHENGIYECSCCVCQNTFTCHKRRVTCKSCAMKPTPAPCPTPEQIVAFVLGLIEDQDGRDRVRRHVHACVRCGREVNALSRAIERIAVRPEAAPHPCTPAPDAG